MKLELSHNNHFRFGYNGAWFNERASEQDEWKVAYGRCRRPVLDWRNECLETARLIRANTTQDIVVLFSGGIDSEVVLQSFMFCRIPVRAAITRFRNDLNMQDVYYAVKFCETHSIPYVFLDLDVEKFFESGQALDYAAKVRCVQPQLLHTMWAMDQIDGYPVLGSGECYLERTSSGSEWAMLEKERIASWYRHLIVLDREGCAGFFQYNPENMYAFLVDEEVAKSCRGEAPYSRDTSAIKALVYRKYFLLEPRSKYHGFENVIHLDALLRPELERKFGDWNAIARTPYSTLVNDLHYAVS
jgi:hypothetical protein